MYVLENLNIKYVKLKYDSLYAQAHLINHPSHGQLPNVYSIDFNWNNILQQVKNDPEVLRRINEVNDMGEGPWYIDPETDNVVQLTPTCAPLAGIAFLASRDLVVGEELLYDYCYEKGADSPEWYHPVVHT